MSTAAQSTNRPSSILESSAAFHLDRIARSTEAGVTIVCGFPASGKSTAARYLAEHTNAVLIDKDTFAPGLEESVMAELTGNAHDRDSEVYMRVVNPHVYTAFVNEALSVGHRVPVIVDAPFIGHIRAAAKQGRSLSDYIRSVATTPAPSVQTVWISADPNQIRERMARRGAPRDVGKLTNWEAYRSDVLESGLDAAAKTVVDHVVRNT